MLKEEFSELEHRLVVNGLLLNGAIEVLLRRIPRAQAPAARTGEGAA